MNGFSALHILFVGIVFAVLRLGNAVELQDIKLETWMRDMPPYIRETPLIHMAIPGSHDSMSYAVYAGNGLGPDAESAVKYLYALFPGLVENWSKTQELDTRQQLLSGIRYFDLRLTTRYQSPQFYFTHGILAGEMSNSLYPVVEFVDTHPGEVVILDFQHFYEFELEDHDRLIKFLLDWFGSRLVPIVSHNLLGITLNSLEVKNQSIILVYRGPQSVNLPDQFWRSYMVMSPWPEAETVEDLYAFYSRLKRNYGLMCVHQAVLTPSAGFIAARILSTNRDSCAIPVLKQALPVISSQLSPGPVIEGKLAPVNIVMADYIDLEDNLFPRVIIAMNNKLK